MADQTNFDKQSRGFNLVDIDGSFAPNGSSALAATSTYGSGFTVVRTSQGLFTITFAEKYPELTSAKVTLQLDAAAARFLQVGQYSASSKTIQIRVIDAAGAVQDVSANANNRVHFTFTFKNSGA